MKTEQTPKPFIIPEHMNDTFEDTDDNVYRCHKCFEVIAESEDDAKKIMTKKVRV